MVVQEPEVASTAGTSAPQAAGGSGDSKKLTPLSLPRLSTAEQGSVARAMGSVGGVWWPPAVGSNWGTGWNKQAHTHVHMFA